MLVETRITPEKPDLSAAIAALGLSPMRETVTAGFYRVYSAESAGPATYGASMARAEWDSENGRFSLYY